MSGRTLLLLSPTTGHGGAEEYMLTVADGAAAAGWRVDVAVERMPQTETLVEELQARSHVRYLDYRISSADGGGGRTLVRQAYPLVRLLARTRPSVLVVVLPWPTRGPAPILAAALAGIPTMVAFQLAPWPIPLGRARRLYRWARRRRQRWVAVSNQNADALAETFELPRSSIQTIHNGAPPTAPSAPAELARARTALRDELDLPPEATVMLMVGRLHDQKGHADLLEIAPAALEGRKDTFLVIAGDGELRADLEAAVEGLGLQGRVLFLGRREDVPALLDGSDLFVLPSRYEGHPFALLEAMAHGVPCVTSDAGGAPEVVRDRVDGLIHARGRPAELAQRLTWALDHPDEMRAMAASAQARVAAFSQERMLKRTLAVLEELASG